MLLCAVILIDWTLSSGLFSGFLKKCFFALHVIVSWSSDVVVSLIDVADGEAVVFFRLINLPHVGKRNQRTASFDFGKIERKHRSLVFKTPDIFENTRTPRSLSSYLRTFPPTHLSAGNSGCARAFYTQNPPLVKTCQPKVVGHWMESCYAGILTLWCSLRLLRHKYYSPACFWTNPSSCLGRNIHLFATGLTLSLGEKLPLWVWMTRLFPPVKLQRPTCCSSASKGTAAFRCFFAVLDFLFVCDVTVDVMFVYYKNT